VGIIIPNSAINAISFNPKSLVLLDEDKVEVGKEKSICAKAAPTSNSIRGFSTDG